MAGTVQRLIRHIWGFISSPAPIENKQQSFNEGDDGYGNDRTQLVAKGPTGILHTFRTWDETTSYISTQISTFGSNIYIEIRTVDEFFSAMQLSDVVSLMIMNPISLDFDGSFLNLDVISSKNIFSLNEAYLNVAPGFYLNFRTNDPGGSRGDIYIDFYCNISCKTNCTLKLIDGNGVDTDYVRFSSIKKCTLDDSLTINPSSMMLYEDSDATSFQTSATHSFWSDRRLSGRVIEKRSASYNEIDRFGENDNINITMNSSSTDGITGFSSMVIGGLCNMLCVVDDYDTVSISEFSITLDNSSDPFLSNNGSKGRLGIGKHVPSDVVLPTGEGIYFGTGSLVYGLDSKGDNEVALTQNCHFVENITSVPNIKVQSTGNYVVVILDDGVKIHQGSGTSGDVITLGTADFEVRSDGSIHAPRIKLGINQSDAGATQNEIWCDLDDDRTLKLGAAGV